MPDMALRAFGQALRPPVPPARAFGRALKPPPRLTVSQWADQSRVLSSEASAEPGKWNTARAPYQREIMDAVSDPSIHTVVVMSSAQVGKTEVLLNMVGFIIDIEPGPMLLIQPTLEMAEAFSKDRLVPMLRDSPTLRAKVAFGRKDAANTILHKTFPGGHITMAGSNSPAGLASRPIRVILADEVDRWEVGKEGDPLALAAKRSATFWNRKLLVTSTPTVKGISRIERRFEESDQRRCFVPCPFCAHRFVLTWSHVKWEPDRPDTAHLECPACSGQIREAGRKAMLRAPEWRPTAPFRGIAGFHLWEAYSPWRRLSDIVADFLDAKRSPGTLQVFVNTSLGETWEERGEQAETHVLLARRERFAAAVPAGACCLTMGVDVQDDRLEALIIGWGPGEESWVVEARVIPGDPSRLEPWQELDELLGATFIHETGANMGVLATCIDTAGHRTQYVYDFVQRRQHQRVYAVIGRGGERPIVSAPSRKGSGKDPRKVDLFTVGVDQCKALIYSRLAITEKGPGFVHLPIEHQMGDELRHGVDEEFVAQLTAEKLVTKHKNGTPHREWVQTRPRNEALDMTVYAVAALRLLRPNLQALADQLSPNPKPPKPPVTPTDPRGGRGQWLPKRGGWLKGR